MNPAKDPFGLLYSIIYLIPDYGWTWCGILSPRIAVTSLDNLSSTKVDGAFKVERVFKVFSWPITVGKIFILQHGGIEKVTLGVDIILSVQEGPERVQQLDTRVEERVDKMPRRQAPRQRSSCGTIGHTIRSCPSKKPYIQLLDSHNHIGG